MFTQFTPFEALIADSSWWMPDLANLIASSRRRARLDSGTQFHDNFASVDAPSLSGFSRVSCTELSNFDSAGTEEHVNGNCTGLLSALKG